MIDGNITTRRQSPMMLIGMALVALAIAGGSWYGFRGASSVTPPQLQVAAPASGPLPNSSGIGKGESIVSKSLYARPPPVFDAVAAMALTASAPLSGASAPTSAAALTTSGTTAGATPTAEVMPAGWARASGSLDQMWESNAAGGWNVRATPLTRPNWRISGVVQRGGQTQVIIQFDGETATQFFKVGDVLPGGGKLTWVKHDVIGVSFPQQKPITVPLVEDPFQPASSAASQAAPANARP